MKNKIDINKIVNNKITKLLINYIPFVKLLQGFIDSLKILKENMEIK